MAAGPGVALPRVVPGDRPLSDRSEVSFDQVARIWEAVADLDPAAQTAALDEACRDQPELRREVESLLAADGRAGSFLDRAVIDPAALRPPESLPPGTALGVYQIVAPLGSGGMGEVYRARDPRLGRHVAIKILSPDLWNNRRALARFEREARAASALNHPTIVQIHEIETATIDRGESPEGVRYIAMELIEGQTLRDRLSDGASLHDALRWLITAAQGLARAHAAGIVHRDLKPENIMITLDGFPKLLDFGLAKLVDAEPGGAMASATREGMAMGTAGYMSPEQVQGKPVDHRSDIFSFGCIVHEVFAGHRAFESDSLIDTLHNIVHRQAPPMRRNGRSASRALQSIVDRCLAKSPEDRFASIEDAAAALSAVVASKDFERGGPWRRRAAAAVVAIAILGSIAYGWRFLPGTPAPVSQPATHPSIGIMPFAAAAESDVYLAEGLAERAAEHLARAGSLRIVPTAAVREALARGSRETIGASLRIHTLVTGRLERRDEKLRVTLEVTDLRDGSRRLTTLERRIDEIPALQQDIVQSLVTTLAFPARDLGNRALVRNETNDTQAYDFFLRGRLEWNRWTESGFRKAIEHFDSALLHDPMFANAHAGISDSYTQLALNNFMAPTEAWPRAKAAALRAITLDPNLGEAHMSLAVVLTWHDWDFTRAEDSYRRAVALSPRSPEVHLAYGFHLAVTGRFVEANREMERARDLNPVSTIAGIAVTESLWFLGDHKRYLAEARQLALMHPEVPNAAYHHGYALQLSDDAKGALRELLRSEELSGASKAELSALQAGFNRDGLEGYWAAVAARYERTGRQQLDCAQSWMLAGEEEKALDAIEKGLKRREAFILWVKSYPMFAPLRENARYQKLVSQMGLG